MEIKLLQADITTITTDAIVNAANSSLLGGGGVDGAIHKKGGSKILEECKQIRNRQGGCKTGEAVYTSAGNLPSKYVIHTVGPVWNNGKSNEPELLKQCYLNSLKIAEKLNLKTIAFPNISTGIYKFPKELAAQIAVETVRSYQSTCVEEVWFICFDLENFEIYDKIINEYKK